MRQLDVPEPSQREPDDYSILLGNINLPQARDAISEASREYAEICHAAADLIELGYHPRLLNTYPNQDQDGRLKAAAALYHLRARSLRQHRTRLAEVRDSMMEQSRHFTGSRNLYREIIKMSTKAAKLITKLEEPHETLARVIATQGRLSSEEVILAKNIIKLHHGLVNQAASL